MKRRLGLLFTVAPFLLLVRCAPAGSSEGANTATSGAAPATAAPSHPSIDGAYRLVYRQMRDGTRLVSPTIDGIMDFVDGYRAVSLIEHNAQGGVVTFSLMSSYTFTDSLYSENVRYRMITGYSPAEGGGLIENRQGSAPVTIGADGSISFTLPLQGVRLTVTSDSLTIALGNDFVDHWARVSRKT